MNITEAYTGARWSEVLGMDPAEVTPETIGLNWKLYELGGRFYRGRPKDGSMRTVDSPPFLSELLPAYLKTVKGQRCTCFNDEEPWCPGASHFRFLGPNGGHFYRSTYGE